MSLAVYQVSALLSATTTLEEYDRYREEKSAKLQKQVGRFFVLSWCVAGWGLDWESNDSADTHVS